MSAGSVETAILRRCCWFSLPERDLCWIEKLEPAKNRFTNNSLKNILQKLILTVCFVLFLPNMSVDRANTAGKPKAACELRSEYPCYRYSFHCSPALSNELFIHLSFVSLHLISSQIYLNLLHSFHVQYYLYLYNSLLFLIKIPFF